MELIVQYSCFQDEHLIEANLKHIYDFADRIVIAYGAFSGVKDIRSLWGLPEEDDTLNIIKSFPDPDKKVTLIEAPEEGWKDFTESRTAALGACGTSGFLMTQDTDEFWAVGALQKIREVASHKLGKSVVAIDCPRIWLVGGVDRCLWPKVGFPYLVPHEKLGKLETLKSSVLLPALGQGRRILRDLLNRPQLEKIKNWLRPWKKNNEWSVFNYANGVAYLPSPANHIYKVVGFLLKPGLFWTKNRIDSWLIDPESGDPWHRHNRAIYEPSICCLHLSYNDPSITRVKETYYKTVFKGMTPEQAYQEVLKEDKTPLSDSTEIDAPGYQVSHLPERFQNILPPELLRAADSGN